MARFDKSKQYYFQYVITAVIIWFFKIYGLVIKESLNFSQKKMSSKLLHMGQTHSGLTH